MTTEDKIKVMQAFIDGEPIECSARGVKEPSWFKADSPIWNWSEYHYRVQKEPREYYLTLQEDLGITGIYDDERGAEISKEKYDYDEVIKVREVI